jgi:HlyD family secretion protein
MTVSIDVEAARRDNALAVPAEAVRDADSPAPWALVVRHGRVERRALVIGLRGAGMVEVIDGLAPGDLVVPSTATAVRVGQRARAGASPAATGSGG